MLDLVRGKQESWPMRFLLMGDRLVLIHLVLSSIPIFQMPVNVLPEGIKKKLHSLVGRFL